LLQEVAIEDDFTERARWGAYLAGEVAREALKRLEHDLNRGNVRAIGGVQ
jgi:hypothetical protein